MKLSTILIMLCAATSGLFADTAMTEPVALADVSYYQSRQTMKVHVSYTLSNQNDEPAYVVMDVLTNGVSIGLDKIKTFADASTVSQFDGAPVAVGSHEIIWNARKDWKGNLSTNAVVQLHAFYTNAFNLYMVVDLSEGPNAARYPVTYTMDEPDPVNDYSCISNKLWLKHVNAGTFMMGSPADEVGRYANNEYQHQVTLTRPFFAGIFPVTAAQYALVTGVNKQLGVSNIYDTETPSLTPAYNVSWDAIRGASTHLTWPSSDEVSSDSFMGLLRAKTGISGFDLPTEAQWEYTCRAGTTTALNSGKNISVAWGGTTEDANMDEVAWYKHNSGSKAHRVGQKLANSWGFYDFHGSVWEWCCDTLQADLRTSASVDPKIGATTDSEGRVQRGAQYGSQAPYARSAGNRSSSTPSGNGGFRVWCNL